MHSSVTKEQESQAAAAAPQQPVVCGLTARMLVAIVVVLVGLVLFLINKIFDIPLFLSTTAHAAYTSTFAFWRPFLPLFTTVLLFAILVCLSLSILFLDMLQRQTTQNHRTRTPPNPRLDA
eukprot:GABV01015066.1.p1 GENE.GABV01015066.1~~GABV01015066.1.p1  ORF type:complete len:140 (-),score=34.65 GABV01015066.1:3-365(-)